MRAFPAGQETDPCASDAPGALYEREYGRILRLCLAYLRSSADAEDATQETFARVMPRMDGASIRSMRPYLAQTARNICRDEMARRLRDTASTSTLTVDQAGRAAEEIATDRHMLEGAWETLRPEDRAVLAHVALGYSLNETAEALGLSGVGVRQRASRARRRAREAVGWLRGGLTTGVVPRLRRWQARSLHHSPALGVVLDQAGGIAGAAAAVAVAAGMFGTTATEGPRLPANAGAPQSLAAAAAIAAPGLPVPLPTSGVDGGQGTPSAAGNGRRAGGLAAGAGAATSPAVIAGDLSGRVMAPGAGATAPGTSFTSFTASPDDNQPQPVIYAAGDRAAQCGMGPGACGVVFRSTDGGRTWAALGSRGYVGNAAVLVPPGGASTSMLYAYSGSTGLERSDDGGASFAVVSGSQNATVAMAPDAPGGDVRLLIAPDHAGPLVVYDARDGVLVPGPSTPVHLAEVSAMITAWGTRSVYVLGVTDVDQPVLLACDAFAAACSQEPWAPSGTSTLILSPTFAEDAASFWPLPGAVGTHHNGVSSELRLPPSAEGATPLAVIPAVDYASSGRVLAITPPSASNSAIVWLSVAGGPFAATGAELDASAMNLNSLAQIPSGDLLVGATPQSVTDWQYGVGCSSDSGRSWRASC